MKQYRIETTAAGNLWRIRDVPTPIPANRQVLVKIQAVSLNYRDVLVSRSDDPRAIIPCSDGAGVVVDIGADVTRCKIGDRVAGLFFQTWFDGPFRGDVQNHALGGAIDGVLAEYVALPEDGVIEIPDTLSFEEAATLPCAALTAWNALEESSAVKPGQTVLLLGTGGVSTFALQFAKAAGARVLMLSSSDAKLERAMQMGADATLNYRDHSDWPGWVVANTDGNGVDLVLDVGGPGTLDKSMAAARHSGTVTITGVLTGFDGGVSPLPALLKSLRLQGIYVGNRAMFERMLQAIQHRQIEPVIDRVFAFAEAPAALSYLQGARHFGKVVVRVH